VPDKKITDLVDGTPLQPTDEFVVARGGDNFKIDGADVVAAVTKHDVTLAGNTAGVLALVSSGTLTLAGGNNITLSQVGNAVTLSGPNTAAQSVQTQNMVAVTLSGNTSGAQALISSGTLTLAGGNNITVSQNGNAVTISGANAGGAQTAISGVVASDATYTSGTVTFTGVGGGVTVNSNTGQRVDISVAAPVAQTVQTQNLHNVTLSGNTAGAMAEISSGTLTLAGGNNITVSQAGNAVTISGANVGGAQTGISGIANSQTTYTSGTVSLSELGAITIRSTTGNQFQFSVNPQSTQVETQTFIAGISASDTLYTSGNVRLTGVGGGVTVSSNTGQRVDISVAAQSVQPETQTFIAGISASDTLYTSGNVRFTGVGGGITVSSNTGQRVDLSVAAQTNQAGSVYAISNTSGTSSGTYDARTLSIAGAGMITVAASNSGWRINATQSVQPETQTAISGIANSQTTYTSGTVSLSELGAITIRSTTGNQFQFSVNSQTAQTQSNIQALYDGANSISTGTIRVTNANGVSFSVNAQTLSASVNESISMFAVSNTTQSTSGTAHKSALSFGGAGIASVGVTGGSVVVSVPAGAGQTGISGIANSQTTYTSGTVSLSELGAITIRSTTGNQYQLSVNAQTTQTQGILSAGVSTGGNTAGNTQVSTGSRLVFVGTNNITLSQGTAAGATTITVSGPTTAAQSVQTQGILNVALSNVGNTAGDTGVNSGTRYVLAGGNNITVSGGTAAGATTVTISAANQTVQTQGVLSAGVSNVGNTSGNTTVNTGSRLVFAGGNNITLSQGTAAGATTITISAPNLGAGAMSAGVSNLGNSAGATGITGTQLVLVGSDNITLSQTTGANGGTVSIIGGGGGGFSAGVSTGGNTAGDTGVTGTRMVLVGTGPISLSQATAAAGGTVSIDAPATSSLSATGGIQISTNGSTISIGNGGDTIADWQNFPMGQAGLQTHIASISKTPFYFHVDIPGRIAANSLAFKMSMVTANTLASFTAHLGVYTFVNSTSMNLLGSLSEQYEISSGSSVSFSGVRNFVMTKIGTHTALSNLSRGVYGFGMMFSAGASQSMNASLMGDTTASFPLGLILPGTNQLSTATSQGVKALWGRGSTTVNAMPAAVVRSELVNQGSGASAHLHPWIYIRS
jgi:fibronectin-binding autotransporter adhesin